MGTALLLFVICLMFVFILLAFIQKPENSEEPKSILMLEEIKKVKE